MREQESDTLQIQRIKRTLYLRMNGVVADQMKQKGLHYRINYGVGLLHLKQIAATLEPDTTLARQLWDEQIRETMILATMLMPHSSYQWQQCQRWILETPTAEIADYFSMNLLSNHPQAIEWLPAIMEMDNQWSISIVLHTLQRLFRLAPDRDRDKLWDILDILTYRVIDADNPKWINNWLLLHYDLLETGLLSYSRVEWIEAINSVSSFFVEARRELRSDFDLSLVDHPIKRVNFAGVNWQ